MKTIERICARHCVFEIYLILEKTYKNKKLFLNIEKTLLC